jgi:hypothetical protein
MAFIDGLYRFAASLLIERPARKRTLAELIAELELSGQTAEERIAAASDNPDNRRTLCHIISIERWGQPRLIVPLGEPFVMDESDQYCPDEDSEWDELADTFRTTRRETVTLARQLQDEGIDPGAKVPHNQWGPFSVAGWLYYLNYHSNDHGKKIK